jgi:hypothetical protein
MPPQRPVVDPPVKHDGHRRAGQEQARNDDPQPRIEHVDPEHCVAADQGKDQRQEVEEELVADALADQRTHQDTGRQPE